MVAGLQKTDKRLSSGGGKGKAVAAGEGMLQWEDRHEPVCFQGNAFTFKLLWVGDKDDIRFAAFEPLRNIVIVAGENVYFYVGIFLRKALYNSGQPMNRHTGESPYPHLAAGKTVDRGGDLL